MYLSLFFLFLALVLLAAFWVWLGFAPWVPTRKRDFKTILDLSDPKPGEKFYELGCGDGRVAAYIAENTEAEVVGVEISWPLFLIAKIRERLWKLKNLKIKFKNLYKIDLSDANVIYLFGLPEALAQRMKKKLTNELKPRSRIITYSFPIKGWQPIKKIKLTEKDLSIYLYKI